MTKFEKELQSLQKLILKYEQSSKDTVAYKALKETIEAYIAKPKVILDDNNCTSLYAKFKAFHSNGDAKLVFPFFDKITDATTSIDNEISSPLPSSIDYFKLYQVLKDSRAIKIRDCFDSLSRIGKFQVNYVFKRRREYLTSQLEQLKTTVNSRVSNTLWYLNEIQKQYNALPTNIQNILTDKEYEQTLILSERDVLLAISATYENKMAMVEGEERSTYAPIRALEGSDYTTALAEVKASSVFGQYKKAYETLQFLNQQSQLINSLKSKKPAPEGISLKTFELHTILKTITTQTDVVEDKERNDNYAEAKKEAIKLKDLWNSFVHKYTEHNYGGIPEEAVKDTRFEDYYKAVNIAYNKSTVTIEALTANIDVNYQSLEAVVSYKKQYRLTWDNFQGAYLLGDPVKKNETDIVELLRQLDVVIKEFSDNPNLKNISSLKAKNLTEERKKWAERLVEVKSILKQKEIWKKNAVEAPEFRELEGLTLKPLNFVDDKYKPVKASKVKIGEKGKTDTNVIDPNDVDQGNLGDCYFLASLASMATTPDFFYGKDDSVIKIIHPEIKKKKRAGELDMKKIQYFSVKMYLPLDSDKKGARTPVNVLVYPSKDLIGKSQLQYAQKADSGELWVAIVERAFAEIRGGYQQLNGGFAEEGYALLMNKKTEDFNRINLDDAAKIRKLKLEYGDENLSKEDVITKKLTDALKGSKISISTPSKSEMLAAGGVAVPGTSLNGDHQIYVYFNNKTPKVGDKPDVVLYETHAYSIEGGANGTFKIRNPHGNPTTGHTYAQEILFELTGKQIVQFFNAIVIV